MLKLYNTLSRKKESFKPLQKGKVSFYTCGPTVYDAAHIGNLRTYVWEDVLRRWLEYGHGLKVKQVMNVTDVEDKIYRSSEAKTVGEMKQWTKRFERQFHADLKALRVKPATKYPRATDYIPQIITMVKKIIRAGFAYERGGSVYFDVRKYNRQHRYGQLLNIDFGGFEAGHRIDNDEYDKNTVQDFALWKKLGRGIPGWKSPWGLGRPGWHIECSVMAKRELGATIDIHAAAVDLKFPHHENEIAQSQTANGRPLARVWLHGEHLLVDGHKMAKSAGNFYTLADIKTKGFSPAVLRLLYLGAHYRSKLDFTWESLKGAEAAYQRIQDVLYRLSKAEPVTRAGLPNTKAKINTKERDFKAALDDDLNTAEALAVAFALVSDLNDWLDAGQFGAAGLVEARRVLDFFHHVLGVFNLDPIKIPRKVAALVDRREQARRDKDFDTADELRGDIAGAGYEVEDTEHGPRLRKIPGSSVRKNSQ